MKEAILAFTALAMFLIVSDMDLADAQREEAALAAQWVVIKSDSGSLYQEAGK